MSESETQQEFYNLTLDELEGFFSQKLGEKSYRATQVFEWVYRHSAREFGEMTNLSVSLRDYLSSTFSFPELEPETVQVSRDGTRKYAFRLVDGSLVESVMIKQPTRMTLCVSSQVGCAMGCSFCRTATMGLKRNLTTSEIIQQVLAVKADSISYGDSFDNIVFMGMGEPLHNLRAVIAAVKILTDKRGLALPPRKITVSTVGIVPAIEKFGEAQLGVNLAVSLNATTNEFRREIMPITRRYSLDSLIDTLKRFPLGRRKRITIEYVMLHGLNDSKADLERLPKLLSGLPVKLNLIPYNENAGLGYKSPPREVVFAWQEEVRKLGLDSTIRWSKGVDIDAACGQLATRTGQKRRAA